MNQLIKKWIKTTIQYDFAKTVKHETVPRAQDIQNQQRSYEEVDIDCF